MPVGQELSWTDAVFTIVSAASLTGLTVKDTAHHFTPRGQAVIALCMQVGGLVVVVFGARYVFLISRSAPSGDPAAAAQATPAPSSLGLFSLAWRVVLFAFAAELLGAVLLWLMVDSALPAPQRLGLSLFHAVSAFGNAGFTLFPGGLEGYRYALGVHLVIAPLIALGGLGFPVWSDLVSFLTARWRSGDGGKTALGQNSVRLGLHTRIVLATTLSLYLFGVAALGISQLSPYFHRAVVANRQSLPELTPTYAGGILADASFMAISARTGGFSTVPVEQLQPGSQFILMTLMAVGASPGGFGGGMKTVTLVVLVLGAWAAIRGRGQARVFGAAMADSLLRVAGILATALVGLIVFSAFLLALSEPYPLGKLLFEATSAAANSGLSLGITPDLTTFGKWVVTATMLAGRVVPIAILASLSASAGDWPQPSGRPA
ncbi:MAG: hypothetical protein IT443_00355 [Phycisphaeraceae bacterium]|nr:hypothetical protein [Phycisphaeraceae bacterium]